jgi:hypothetical protein
MPEVQFLQLSIHSDERGELLVVERLQPIPFDQRRVFVLSNMKLNAQRACHAVSCDEFFVVLAGECKIETRKKSSTHTHHLTVCSTGMYVPAGIWMRMFDFSEGFCAMVICSARYEDTIYYTEPQF